MASHQHHVVSPRNLEALAAFFLWRFWLHSRAGSVNPGCASGLEHSGAATEMEEIWITKENI